MKQSTLLKTNPDLLKAYVILFKDFKQQNNYFMAKNILDRLTDCLIDDGYTLKQMKQFYKDNLNTK